MPLTKHSETRGEINEKTVSIRVSVLKNHCPIFYGISRIWVEFKDILKNFEVDFILKSYKKCDNT